MSHIPLSSNGKTPFERLLGHVPEVLNKWDALELAFFNSNTFEAGFLEQLRRALAFNNQCHYCMAKAGPPDTNIEDNRLIVAMRFANKFSISHQSIDPHEIEQLQSYFSDEEIVELVAFCSFISASQQFGAVLGLRSSATYVDRK